MRLPIETFLDDYKADDLDQSFLTSMNDLNSLLMKDHIELNELIKSGFITYILNNSSVDKKNLSQSFLKRYIISKYFDGSNDVRILKKDDFKEELKNQEEKKLYSLKVLSKQETFVPQCPFWPIDNFPSDWKRISKQNQLQFIAGGSSPTFTSWRGLGIDKFKIESIILLDRYILDFKKNGIISLEKLLEGLISKNRRTEKIDLTIVTRVKPAFEGTNNYATQLRSEVLNKLQSKWPNLSLAIQFVPPSYIHGRYLLTDFYYITADYGFCLYGERGLNRPRASNLISFHPISYNNAYKIYRNLLSHIKAVFENGDIIQSAGEKGSKLFRILVNESQTS